MSSFIDNQGRTWCVRITVSTLRRIKDMTGASVNLADFFGEDGALAKLATDPLEMVKILYAIMKPDADRCGLSEEQFCDAISGDAIEEATNAIILGIADFFPKSQGALLRRLLAMGQRQRDNALKKAVEAIQDESPSTESSGTQAASPE